MYPTSSFFGKCTTVLIGAGLSWLTVTNQDAGRVASRLFGSSHERIVGEAAGRPTAEDLRVLPGRTSDATEGKSEAQQMEEISEMLKELGATYLRVEKLGRSGETWFRVRCDLDGGPDQVKCCLESTRDSALAAMKDVLRAADPEI